MKNVYLLIAFLVAMGMQAQNLQNANWYFGYNGGLSFLSSSPAPLYNSSMEQHEGCASISDKQGQVLFYTDGITVWKSDHSVMTNGNGLLGDFSATQSAIIVPNPSSTNKYYIFTIHGGEPVYGEGLHYSEVDMSAGGGTVLLQTKNTILKDHNGVDININYYNASQKLTSAKHSNGTDYWVVTQIRDKFYSYLVSSNGVSISPFTTSQANLTIQNGQNSSSNILPGIGNLKISPDGTRLAVAYSRRIMTGSNYGAINLGSFNSTTGVIQMDSNLIQLTSYETNYYGLEFSSNSQYIYFLTTDGQTGHLHRTQNSTSTIYSQSTPGIYVSASLQLAIDNKIYISNWFQNKLSVINNPNNLSSPNLEINTVSTGCSEVRVGLPQLIPWQAEQECSSLTLSFIQSGNQTYSNKSDITTELNYAINSGTDIIMHAADFIVLKPDTHIKSGAVYLAEIQECETGGGGTSPRMAAPKEFQQEPETLLAGKTFSLIPNPATTRVTISASVGVQSVLVTSLDGKTMFSREYKDKSATIDIDINAYAQGYYTVTVITTDGQVQTQKLIKN
jgi:hypothetical protein